MANESGLAALLAKKKANDGQDSGPSGGTASAMSDSSAPLSESESSAQPIPSEAKAETGQAERPKNPFAAGKNSGPNDSSGPVGVGPSAASGVNSSDMQSRPKLAGLSLKSESQPTDSDASGVDAPTISSLDDLDASEDEGIAPRQSMSQFADETPATKPTRELPEGLDKNALGFIDMIDGVYDVLHDADMMGSVIRNIIIELKSHPEYMKLVAPDDIRAWVRGMRETMGLAKIKKQESKAKRSGGAGKKSKLVDEDMLADLNSLGVEIPE